MPQSPCRDGDGGLPAIPVLIFGQSLSLLMGWARDPRLPADTDGMSKKGFSSFFFFFVFLPFSRASPAAYGGSQARGLIGAVAAGLCQSHSNAGI